MEVLLRVVGAPLEEVLIEWGGYIRPGLIATGRAGLK